MKVLQINIFGNLSTGRIAVDLYRTLKENGLVPAGCEPKSAKRTPQTVCTASGWQCTCRVLTEGAMNY